MAFRNPRPNNGGNRPVKSEVVYSQRSVIGDDLREIISRPNRSSGGCLQPNFEYIQRRPNHKTSYARDITSNEIIDTLRLDQ